MPEQYPSVGSEDGSGEYLSEVPGQGEGLALPDSALETEDLIRELETLEFRLATVTELVRALRGENAELRTQNLALLRERDALWRERGVVSTRLAQIIAKVDALRGEP